MYMNKNNAKKIGILLLLLLQLSCIIIPGIGAVTLDGSVTEPTWNLWIIDSGDPSFSVFYWEDTTNVYIGIVTSGTEFGQNDIELAFQAIDYDWAIKLSDISGHKYVKSISDPVTDYWGPSKLGLPDGVNIVQGSTDGKISYEISIEKELLGKKGEEFPTNFKMWLMVSTDSKGNWIWSIIDVKSGVANFYPESREGWWFEFIDYGEIDEIPTFHAPEFPLGSITAVIMMFAAMIVVGKKNTMQSH
jgi:hypothetical protein